MSGPTVCVVGSANLDLIARCAMLPAAGETALARELLLRPGGKGANQALAARRAGAEVTLLAGVGCDAAAEATLAHVDAAGVDLTGLARRAGTPTGIALITVSDDGQNTVVVAAGANGTLSAVDLPEALGQDAVLCQLEIPLDAVLAAAQRTSRLFCLNASPARGLPPDLLERIDVLLVNEGEHRSLSVPLRPDALVVVTLGEHGAVAWRDGQVVARSDSFPVDVLDTVGAGDCFAGAFVTALARGDSVPDSLRYACAAGALATTQVGAQEALPVDAQIRALLQQGRQSAQFS